MRSIVVAVALTMGACGYQPLYATPAGEAFHVHLAKSQVSSILVAEEVVRGARDALAKEGALAPGEGYPRLEIEVLRADETSEGVMTTGPAPRARATELGVVVRAWVTRRPGATPEQATGDVRAEDLAATPLGDPAREVWQREDTLRAVARRLGTRIALRALGHPLVTE